jgi:hypothetical protein
MDKFLAVFNPIGELASVVQCKDGHALLKARTDAYENGCNSIEVNPVAIRYAPELLKVLLDCLPELSGEKAARAKRIIAKFQGE